MLNENVNIIDRSLLLLAFSTSTKISEDRTNYFSSPSLFPPSLPPSFPPSFSPPAGDDPVVHHFIFFLAPSRFDRFNSAMKSGTGSGGADCTAPGRPPRAVIPGAPGRPPPVLVLNGGVSETACRRVSGGACCRREGGAGGELFPPFRWERGLFLGPLLAGDGEELRAAASEVDVDLGEEAIVLQLGGSC